jgi:hypothetical protein
MQFRIVQLVHCVNELNKENGNSSIEFIIEKKNFWGWKEVLKQEIRPSRISHKTYEDAEAYLMSQYMGHGMCTINGTVYTYEPYSYWV